MAIALWMDWGSILVRPAAPERIAAFLRNSLLLSFIFIILEVLLIVFQENLRVIKDF
jgi:hypothetical protein